MTWFLLALAACSPSEAPHAAPARRRAVDAPPPAIGPDLSREEDNARRRNAWIEERHRHPPDVDWHAVEAENGRRAMERRNLRARAPVAKTAGSGAWMERGSDNQAGSMYTVALSPDGAHLYAGSDRGGLWRATLDGDDWTPVGDNLYGGAHRILALPPDEPGGPDVLVVGTDQGVVHRSGDGGASWIVPPGTDDLFNGLLRLVAATDGTVYAVLGYPGYGRVALVKSTDRGATFTEVRDLRSQPADLWTPRIGDPVLYLVVDGQLEVSTDGGTTWEVRGAVPDADAVQLAGSEAGALYLAVNDRGVVHVHRSVDDGGTWSEVSDGPSDYWSQLQASITDPDRYAYGGVEVWVSRDGGETTRRINAWSDYYGDPVGKLHADLMGLTVVPDGAGGEVWYVGTHGGISRSFDHLDTVENISLHGLRVSQYYSTLTSTADPAHVIAGAQDQGWQWTGTADWEGDGRFDFSQTESGDYGHLTSGDGTHTWVFGVYPGFIMASHRERDPELFYLEYPDDPVVPYWLPVVVADPEDPASFFWTGGHLWRYTRDGDWWTEEHWANRDFSASSYEYLSALAFAPTDPETAYAATSLGKVWVSHDHAKTWEDSASVGVWANWLYGTALSVSRRDPQLVYLGGSGYGGPGVLRSEDGGESWLPWSTGLPDTTVNALCDAPDGSGTMFAATDAGAFSRAADGDAWVDISDAGAPLTVWWSCESLAWEDTIRFATYGRGIWDYRIVPQGEGCYPERDDDGDGVGCATDCDDADPARYPGAPEACDGLDSDCDGAFEGDDDHDGFIACADCDDGDPAIHPLAPDVCDGVDQDCDGGEDECIEARGCGGCASAPTDPAAGAVVGGALALLVARRRRGR